MTTTEQLCSVSYRRWQDAGEDAEEDAGEDAEEDAEEDVAIFCHFIITALHLFPLSFSWTLLSVTSNVGLRAWNRTIHKHASNISDFTDIPCRDIPTKGCV